MNAKKELEVPNVEGKVVIWKMNYGTRQDLEGDIQTIEFDSMGKKKVKVDMKRAKILTLAYGIYSAESIGIPVYSDERMGLSESELAERIKVVRTLEKEVGEYLNEQINILNTDSEKTDVKEE